MIKPFDIKKEVMLTTNASEHTVVAIISQEGHPVIQLPRKLTAAETNYSYIEKEALAILLSTERVKNFFLR